MRDGGAALSIVAEGSTDESRFANLTDLFGSVVVSEVPAGTTRNPSALNPIVDEASSNWILLVREGERVSATLAGELARSMAPDDPHAWGYRIGVRLIYCGEPVVLGRPEPGDVRLFHRRKARLQKDGKMKVQGTVVRLASTLDLVLYDSEEKHVAALMSSGRVKIGSVRRLTTWLLSLARHGSTALRSPARRFLWIEAGWDAGSGSAGPRAE